ncbi:MAG: hypothetical protein DLM73_02325 [Chthoniobacterales bacterium]|nr:MAG: hypothetical protein DLM73_02325 [Chthoniobacterales bacterium]
MRPNEPSIVRDGPRSSLAARAAALTATAWLLLVTALLPPSLAFAIQKKHWINIPIWDEWDTPGIALLHFAQRHLTWADLLAQHNESRKIFPRLIHIAIASVAGWDVRQGMVLTFLCACAASACAFVYLRRRARGAQPAVLFAWLLVNLLLFAPSQYENFLSGFAFEIFIPFLCLFGCCAINLTRWPLPAKAGCNAFLALLSSYTFANGMLLWALAIPIPGAEERSRRRSTLNRLLCYALYFGIAIISIGYYFVGYKRPAIAPPSATLNQLPGLLEFLLVWLGAVLRSPCFNTRANGALVALCIIAALSGALLVLKSEKARWRNYYPWLVLLAFAVASGAMTAVGRLNIGIDVVFNTWFNGFSGLRYNATSVFAYVAVIGLVFNLYQDRIIFRPVLRSRFLIFLTAACTFLIVAWLQMLSDELIRVKEFQTNRRRARTAVIWINALPDNPEIFLAYPYPDGFWGRVKEMREAGLVRIPQVSESLRRAIASPPIPPNSAAGHLDLGERRSPGNFRFAGWARSPLKNARADYVVLGWEETNGSFHPFTAIKTGILRPDVANVFGRLSLEAGFDQEIEVSRLPAQTVTIRAWSIDWQTQQAFPLDGVLQLEWPRL